MSDKKRDEERGHRRRHHKRHKDFWHDWRQERHRLWQEMDESRGDQRHEHEHRRRSPFPPRKRAVHWRAFFHDFMGDWPEDHWAFGGRRFNPWRQGKDEFNPFVASFLSKGGGLLPIYVLHLLSQQPRYGNEVMERITERTGGQWVANPGAIYPLMTTLEEQGLIEGEWEDPRKRTVRIYRLTEAGEQELARLIAIVRPKLEEAIEVLRGLANDLNGDQSEAPE
ncbi:MAG: helix-turn-helix transcriptional regulator [Chloroflexi bacterium]|nr:helix-turn-helix transcriptional regulator [Chloroflexota bacterium]